MEETVDSFVHCASCSAQLAFGTFFCGKCGSAQLQSMLLPGNKVGHSVVQSSTTANYDPANPKNKPWKDTTHLKGRPILPPKITLETQQGRSETPPPAVPWRPTMKQMAATGSKEELDLLRKRTLMKKAKGLPLKDKKGRGSSRVINSTAVMEEGGDDRDISAIIQDEMTEAGSGEVVRQKLVYYKNYAFRKRGERVRKVKPVVKKEKTYDDSYREMGEQTVVHPVAVYEAEWISTPGFTIHASLMVRSHGDKKDEHVTRYFLRVAATYEDPKVKERLDDYDSERISTAHGGRLSRKGKRTDGGEGGLKGEGKNALEEGGDGVSADAVNVDNDNDGGGDGSNQEQQEGQGQHRDLVILGVFQNDVGRLLTKPQQYWVDLNLIRADEYYMAAYLQASLEFVAKRVHVTPSFNLANLVDQVSLVEPLEDTGTLPSHALRNTGGLTIPAKSAVITEQDLALFKRRHKRALLRKKLENRMAIKKEQEEREAAKRQAEMEDPTYRPEASPDSPERLLTITVPKFETPSEVRQREAYVRELKRKNRAATAALGPPGGEMILNIDRTVAQRSCRIPVGKIYENNYVLTLVRMSINYPDPEFLLNDALPLRSEDPDADDLLYADVSATEVVLHMFPMYSERYAAPKIISLEVGALPVLLGSGFIGVDESLKQGFDTTADMLRRLTQLLHFYSHPLPPDRFGKVKEQLRVGITGVAVIPFIKDVDEVDSDSDSEEVAAVATFDFAEEVMIELLDSTVKELVFDLKRIAEEERIHRLFLESWGSVAIQRVARGFTCRCKQLIPKKREERRILIERARVGSIKMQSIIRMYMARVPVRERKLEVARIKRERELEEEAARWAAQVAAQEAALAAAEQELREKEAAEAAAEAARIARLDKCWCHGVTNWRLDTIIKDTELRLFGRFTCRAYCEHEKDPSKMAIVSAMHDNTAAMEEVKHAGRFGTDHDDNESNPERAGMWVLRLGVVEAMEGDGFGEGEGGVSTLTEEESPCQDVVFVNSDDLCAIAEMVRKERVLMRKEQEEVEEEEVPDETEEERDLNQEAEPERVLNRSILDASGHIREEIFRRCCSGISIAWRYDGALEATFSIQAVEDQYEVFYDDDGDLVMGI